MSHIQNHPKPPSQAQRFATLVCTQVDGWQVVTHVTRARTHVVDIDGRGTSAQLAIAVAAPAFHLRRLRCLRASSCATSCLMHRLHLRQNLRCSQATAPVWSKAHV